jgi:hypothetical protein
VLLGDHPLLELVGEIAAKLGRPLFGTGENESLHPLLEGDVAGTLSELLVGVVDVGLVLAASRVEVGRSTAPETRLAGMEIYFSETVGLYLLFPVGAAKGRDHEVPEPLGVEHRGPVRLVLVQHERQGPHVGVPPAGRLRNVHLQTVDLEEVILFREDGEL